MLSYYILSSHMLISKFKKLNQTKSRNLLQMCIFCVLSSFKKGGKIQTGLNCEYDGFSEACLSFSHSTIHYDSAPRPQRSCFANSTVQRVLALCEFHYLAQNLPRIIGEKSHSIQLVNGQMQRLLVFNALTS